MKYHSTKPCNEHKSKQEPRKQGDSSQGLLTRSEVIEIYKRAPGKKMSLYDFMECARIRGMVEE